MDGNKEEQESKKDNAHPRNAQKMKKNSTELQAAVCDSDSCECHCEDKHVNLKEGSRRKSRSGSNPTKAQNNLKSNVKVRKTLTVPCSSSEACEYDRENGEDDEDDEGETTQREHPELSSLLHDLCNSKFGNNSNESKLKSQQKNQRDPRTLRPNQKSTGADHADEIQTSQSTSHEAETTGQTCDFLSGLHYAIPFLSDRLRSSLFSRLRCHSEPKDMGAVNQHDPKTQDNNPKTHEETYHSDSYHSNDSESFPLEGYPCSQNQHLPLYCHGIPSPCQQADCDHDNNINQPCKCDCHVNETLSSCKKFDECECDSQTLIGSLPSQFEQPSCSSHFYNGPCNLESSHLERGASRENYFSVYHGEDGTMIPCDNDSESCGVWDYNEELCAHDGHNSDDVDIGNTPEIPEDHHSMPHSENSIFRGQFSSPFSDEGIEESMARIVEEMGKIDVLGQMLEDEDDMSSDCSDYVPDLFSSLSSDSCQADDEFECDCGHCEGSGPGHHDNCADLDWQIAGRLESHGMGTNSSVQNRSLVEPSHDSVPVGVSVTSELEDDDIEEGVYQISLLPPLDTQQLETMFEAMIAQLQEINLAEEAPPPASTSTIQNLPYSTVTAQQIDDLAPCSICLSSFVDMDTSSHLPCNHLFHLHCIKAWLVKSATCPVCRCRVQPQSGP